MHCLSSSFHLKRLTPNNVRVLARQLLEDIFDERTHLLYVLLVVRRSLLERCRNGRPDLVSDGLLRFVIVESHIPSLPSKNTAVTSSSTRLCT